MDIYNRQLSHKDTIIRHQTVTDAKPTLAPGPTKKKGKNITIEVNKNQADFISRQQRSKSKDKERRKNNQASFNDVVTKFKKLFDDKIKFIRDEPDAITQRIDNKQKKSSGWLDATQGKMKKVGSLANFGSKKNTTNTTKQGFSELISDIQAKLNMHRNLKERQKQNYTQRQFISIDDNQSYPLKSLYKPKIKASKSKEKTHKSKSKSKQKYGSTSRTLSAIKKTQRVNVYESFEEDEIDKLSKAKAKSKNKNNRTQSNKVYKKVEQIGAIPEDRMLGNLTIRQKNSAKYRSSNLSQGKYKNRVKTFQSENVNERENAAKIQKVKSKKIDEKSKKQKNLKQKNQQDKIKKKDKEKVLKQTKTFQQKSSKRGLLDRSKQKKKASRNDQKQSEIIKKKRSHNLVITVGKNQNVRKIQPTEQFLFENNLHSKVSSSLDEKDQEVQCSSEQEDSSVEQESLEDSENEIVNKNQGKVLGSVIMYDVGKEGDLNFSQHIESDNTDQQHQSNFSSAHQLKNVNGDQLEQYIHGFRQYVLFQKKKNLLKEFLSPISFQSQKSQATNKRQLSEKPKLQETNRQQQKMYIKIEHALKEEELKWLNFKRNLERIRKCDNFSEEIEKIILEAEENHLALKSMEIKEATSQKLINQAEQQRNSFIQHEYERNGEISEKTFKTVTGPKEKNYMEQNSQSLSELGATLKTPIRNQGNQINININIGDAEIKIQSPNKNYAVKSKHEKIQEKQEVLVPNHHKMEIVIRKDQPKRREHTKKEKSFTDSESSLRNLMDQCCNQAPKNRQSPAEPKRQFEAQVTKSIVENKIDKIEVKIEANQPKKVEEIKEKPIEKKKKLSYEQAPLQIKKILQAAPHAEEQKQIKVQEKKKLLLQSDLDLSQFMSSKAIDHSMENSSVSNKNDKRIKIFQEIKSPSSYRNIHLFKDSRIQNQSKQLKQQKEQNKNRIKISLFSSNNPSNERQSNRGKQYRSQGHLEIVHPDNKLLSKSGNRNFILLHPKKGSQISSPQPNLVPSKNTITEKQSEQEQSPKKQTYLNSQSWLIQDQQTQRAIKEELKPTVEIYEQPIKQQQQFIVDEGNRVLNQENNIVQEITQHFDPVVVADSDGDHTESTGFRNTTVNEKQEEQVPDMQNMFKKSDPPRVKIDHYNECWQLIAEELISQFITDLLQVDEIDRPRLVNSQWLYNKIGQDLISFYNNAHNIQIGEGSSSEQLMTSPYHQIGQHQIESSANDSAHEEASPDDLSNKVKVDTSYIINLVSDLFDFIESHTHQYNQFTSRIKKPLGVDTLHLLKVLRDNQIGPGGSGHQQEGLEGELDQFFQPEDNFLEEDNQDYYIISLESLAMFQNQTFTGQSNTNQQFFNQAVYDKVNMILDNLRPYGTKGLPVLNFMHKHKIRDQVTGAVTFNVAGCKNLKMNQHKSFQQTKYYLLTELMKILKIRLGLFSYDVQSDKITQYSLEKLVREYALEMDEQWRTLNDGDFEVKHSIMLGLEDWILLDEIQTIYEVLHRRNYLNRRP